MAEAVAAAEVAVAAKGKTLTAEAVVAAMTVAATAAPAAAAAKSPPRSARAAAAAASVTAEAAAAAAAAKSPPPMKWNLLVGPLGRRRRMMQVQMNLNTRPSLLKIPNLMRHLLHLKVNPILAAQGKSYNARGRLIRRLPQFWPRIPPCKESKDKGMFFISVNFLSHHLNSYFLTNSYVQGSPPCKDSKHKVCSSYLLISLLTI
jgi:hypothetical protein